MCSRLTKRSSVAEAVLAQIPDPVILVDQRAVVIEANRAAYDLLAGLKTGHPLSFALRTPDVLDGIQEVLDSGQALKVEYSERIPTERTFEVGLRKALGATRKQILLQFLIESALLCVVGGMIGLLLAAGITQLITVLAGMTMTITIGYIILSVAVSSIIGIIAGLYPAWKAARLDPIIALTQT